MAVEHISKLIIQNDSQANVELNTGAITEVCFGRDTSTGAIGYSIDLGETWTWLPFSGDPAGNYRQFVHVMVSGDISFIISDGHPVMALQELE